jgi:transposase
VAGRELERERRLGARDLAVIRVDAIWLAVDPMDMRAGTETALARVVKVFGAAHPHHAYIFANGRANRIKILVHDGFGVWLAARRLNTGRFAWPQRGAVLQMALSAEQLSALVIGLPWQRLGENSVIRVT